MQKFFSVIYLHTLLIFIFSFVLVSLSPCFFSGVANGEYEQCTIETLSNHYIIAMSLISFVSIIAIYIKGKYQEAKLTDVVISIIVVMLISLASYYLYLPYALKQIGEFEVYLDTLLE